MDKWQNRYYLRLKFEVVMPITNLEYFQGIYWSAMLRHWLRPYFPLPLNELGIYPIPVHNGIQEFYPGEIIAVDLSLPEDSLLKVQQVLQNELSGNSRFQPPVERIHFVPGKSLKLLSYEFPACRNERHLIDINYIFAEAEALRSQKQLEIVFHTPLRLKPVTEEKGQYRYLDPIGFSSCGFFSALAREFNLQASQFPELLNKGLIWLDVPYEKTLGGLVGGIRLDNTLPNDLLVALVAGQYCGIGKNRSFGFGFYYLNESPNFRQLPPAACTNLLSRCSSIQNLETALEEMKSGSPGPDNLAREDLVSSGKFYLTSARKMLLSGHLEQGDTLTFRKRSHNGNYRLVQVQNIHERHLLLSVLRQIEGSMDSLLSPGCYSYRSGRDYHQAARKVFTLFRSGFHQGLKADIQAFFDSIDRTGLRLLLSGLLNTDPLLRLISAYMLSPGIGIPQGNPLSPLLSNLWLISFDREIKNSGWQLVRYADDFCIIAEAGNPKLPTQENLAEILNCLQLKLSPDKSITFFPSDTIVYCGYSINSSGFEKVKQPKVEDYAMHGIPAFQTDFSKGKPLYITFKDSYVRAENGSLVIQKEDGNKILGYKDIARIIIIGKPRISAGAIQQALLQQKPVVFMTINGHQLGGFAYNQKLFTPKSVYNPVSRDWDSFCLEYIRCLVAAKLHNQRMVLKQNKIEEPRLKELELSLTSCSDADSLRGKEGAASVIYWQHFRELVKPLSFPRRAYHPPEGPVNAMLSIGYSNLYYRMAECLQAAQLNPYEGIFHSPRGLHYALASDLIEPFRFLVDRIVLSLIHNKQMGSDSFINSAYGSYSRLSSEAMKIYIHRYEFSMRNEVKLGEETLCWALLIDRAAAQLMRCLRLGMDYRPLRLG